MQVRQVIAAALLAVTAVGAMSQEIDPSETLQGKSLAAQTATSERTRASVVAETRNLQADGQLKATGELAEAPVVNAVPQPQAVARTRADVKKETAQWFRSHKATTGELG